MIQSRFKAACYKDASYEEMSCGRRNTDRISEIPVAVIAINARPWPLPGQE
jgi:hypothetical protein